MKIYMFDVDDTLEFADGPVKISQLLNLKSEGNILGICGNWAYVAYKLNGWHRLFSIIGPLGISKAAMLSQIRCFIFVNEYIMVGNEVDRKEAEDADWKFILEKDFKEGI